MTESHEHALNEYHKDIEKREKSLEAFNERADMYFRAIEDAVIAIKELEAEYPDCDLEVEIKERIEEVL